ncbi:MAG: hypothetical protein R3268_15655, partial [Acidiferrobacterales bacterium]|nr:hypothetical protein [Acidiferrobacterales bacterium]
MTRINKFPSTSAGTLRKQGLVLAQSESGAVTDTPRQPTDESPRATPYVDKLIDPSIVDQPAVEELRAPRGLGRYGSGSAGIEYRYYRSKAT